VSLLGGLTKPLDRLGIVFGHPFANSVHHSQVELRAGIPLLGGILGHPEF